MGRYGSMRGSGEQIFTLWLPNGRKSENWWKFLKHQGETSRRKKMVACEAGTCFPPPPPMVKHCISSARLYPRWAARARRLRLRVPLRAPLGEGRRRAPSGARWFFSRMPCRLLPPPAVAPGFSVLRLCSASRQVTGVHNYHRWRSHPTAKCELPVNRDFELFDIKRLFVEIGNFSG